MTGPRVFFYVQYLQGVGHLYRSLRIARAMAEAGLDIDLVSGGMPVPGLGGDNVRLHQLTPIKCRDGDFGDLVGAGGQPLDAPLVERRRSELLSLFRTRRPAALVIEAFPFGRRQMRFELLPLLELARSASPRPLVICSIRDILQVSGKPGRIGETLDLVERFFDRILVHGDPAFVTLDETFSGAGEIAGKLHYTGMVSDQDRPACVSRGRADAEVLVSAGGGGTQSEVLLAAAMAARAVSHARHRPWRLLAGPNLPKGELARLLARAPEGVTIEPNRSDFAELLAQCAVSVSQAGYNTVADLLRCGCRQVLVPYSARGQSEQLFRARRLQERGLAQLVEQASLGPETLAAAVDAALAAQPPGPAPIDLGGAEKSATLVSGWIQPSVCRSA
jgi:predicted glycosyltransferase